MTSLRIWVSPFRRTSFAPQGSTGCVTPSDLVANTRPHVVRCASPGAPREPANAVFQPVGAGALANVGAAPPSLRCCTTATAPSAAGSPPAASSTSLSSTDGITAVKCGGNGGPPPTRATASQGACQRTSQRPPRAAEAPQRCAPVPDRRGLRTPTPNHPQPPPGDPPDP